MNAKPEKPPKNLTGKTIVTPQGKIRPGNNRAYHRGTLKDQEERIDFCLKLLVRGATKTEIHRAMDDKFTLDYRTIDDIYIVRAEKLRIERAAISTGEARDFVITNLLDVVKTEKGSVRVSACAELAEIFGCYAPKQHRVGDPQGNPMGPAVIAPTVNYVILDNGRGKQHELPEVTGNGH